MYVCVCSAMEGEGSGRICFEGVHSTFGMHCAYQWFPALLNVQAPTVFLREMGYRPLSNECLFSIIYLSWA